MSCVYVLTSCVLCVYHGCSSEVCVLCVFAAVVRCVCCVCVCVLTPCVYRVCRYGIMHSCWQEDPNNRPSFNRLVQELDKMLTSSLKDEVRLQPPGGTRLQAGRKGGREEGRERLVERYIEKIERQIEEGDREVGGDRERK